MGMDTITIEFKTLVGIGCVALPVLVFIKPICKGIYVVLRHMCQGVVVNCRIMGIITAISMALFGLYLLFVDGIEYDHSFDITVCHGLDDGHVPFDHCIPYIGHFIGVLWGCLMFLCMVAHTERKT